jgi:hypothetical protein
VTGRARSERWNARKRTHAVGGSPSRGVRPLVPNLNADGDDNHCDDGEPDHCNEANLGKGRTHISVIGSALRELKARLRQRWRMSLESLRMPYEYDQATHKQSGAEHHGNRNDPEADRNEKPGTSPTGDRHRRPRQNDDATKPRTDPCPERQGTAPLPVNATNHPSDHQKPNDNASDDPAKQLHERFLSDECVTEGPVVRLGQCSAMHLERELLGVAEVRSPVPQLPRAKCTAV